MANNSIIPKPVSFHQLPGYFQFSRNTVLAADPLNAKNAAYLRNLLSDPMGYPLAMAEIGKASKDSISLQVDENTTGIGEEGYLLSITPEGIHVKGKNPQGVFYGIQTLRQLLPAVVEKRIVEPGIQWQIGCCEIRDTPRFSWRGYMLDEGRHFHGKATVLRLLDILAYYKFNVFHWHLTEDQGWRIEIKRYPKLTDLGSVRAGTAQHLISFGKNKHDGVPHGGYYTQEEIREIVQYAADRNIKVVPEIEIPGHSRAALAAYPELSCTGEQLEVPTNFGIHRDIYCAGKEATFTFIEQVLDEVMALFPSKIIHIGGDEAPKARWKMCPDCQQRMAVEGLADVRELQTYFVNRIADYLKKNGRRMMGWNEILEDKLDNDVIVQYWVRNKERVIDALRQGQPVVNSAYLDTYLDHSYSLTSLKRAYEFEPVFEEVDDAAAEHILGLEAPMWTEWVPNFERLAYQTFPRLTAFAEVGWTIKADKNYDDFYRRLKEQLSRLDYWEVPYAPEKDWMPPWYARLLGIFTIAQPQTKVRSNS